MTTKLVRLVCRKFELYVVLILILILSGNGGCQEPTIARDPQTAK